MTDFNYQTTGYVGTDNSIEERETDIELLRRCGIRAWINPRFPSSLWVDPENTFRAREIRRGFRAAMKVIGDPADFLTGFANHPVAQKLTLKKRNKKKQGNPHIGKAELAAFELVREQRDIL